MIAVIYPDKKSSESIIYEELKAVFPTDEDIQCFGVCEQNEEVSLSAEQTGLLTALLINSKIADFVIIAGYEGDRLLYAANSFPNVLCGSIMEIEDFYMTSGFSSSGSLMNSIVIPYEKKFGFLKDIRWTTSEVFSFSYQLAKHLEYRYYNNGLIPENCKSMIDLKKLTYVDIFTILKNIDLEMLKVVMKHQDFFESFFYKNCKSDEIAICIKELLKDNDN